MATQGTPSYWVDRAMEAENALRRLRKQLASPPEGWYTLGTHIDPETGKKMDVELEFWGDDDGTPFWERPKGSRTFIPVDEKKDDGW